MTLTALGWDPSWPEATPLAPGHSVARVATAHRGAVEVIDDDGRFWAEPTGRMFHRARDARALPIVGDWVIVTDAAAARASGARAPLVAILPRRTALVRKAAGEAERPQPLVANVDVALILASANLDLNPRRLERYLAIVRAGGVAPVVVVSKLDLVDDPGPVVARLTAAADGAPVLGVAALRGDGLDALAAHLGPGRTVTLLGSSGVGKTTLLNRLTGAALPTAPVRAGDDRGVHTTTRRELHVTETLGVVIDTPGMRELALYDDEPAAAFDDVAALAVGCRFADCQHRREPGCAVVAAVAAGALTAARLAGFHKLADEQAARARRLPPRRR
ncbi:MAG: ribosome small subunit-dependent GTPase A [Kofleriaceae bacterium]|nr:ribosome small subunit-dependent GTPase A [Kofleriaceae bacterium]MBP9172430.1 ribosome small subunit-dependent GTPase A [Kofleriaceae bacterium]MBP9860556.1 ribosome small subunit-dependent GTPase A [Kofleriaceae bacterium]